VVGTQPSGAEVVTTSAEHLLVDSRAEALCHAAEAARYAGACGGGALTLTQARAPPHESPRAGAASLDEPYRCVCVCTVPALMKRRRSVGFSLKPVVPFNAGYTTQVRVRTRLRVQGWSRVQPILIKCL
jgi:hypothetical protein